MPATRIKKPTLAAFTRWVAANRSLVNTVRDKRAFAAAEKARVDAYLTPVFAKFSFVADIDDGAPITDREMLYLSTDDAQCKRYYAACDVAHRAHGFTGPVGHCPALIANTEVVKAEQRVLDSLAIFLDNDAVRTACGDNRAKALQIAFDACGVK